MAVLELGDQPFFSDKNRAFWNLHSAGWGGATALYAATGIANNRPLDFLLPVLISSVTGYSISLLLSVVFRNVINQRPLITWGATFVSVMLATMLYAYIDTWVVQTIVEGADQTHLRNWYWVRCSRMVCCSVAGRRSITPSTISSAQRNRRISCCGWRLRRPARS